MYNLCCISLELKKRGFNHRAMRFTQFEKHKRDEALTILGDRILENLNTTLESMKFAKNNGWGYRISSTLFPLFNLEKANVELRHLPNVDQLLNKMKSIRLFNYQYSPREFRISFHPDHFNVLCSANSEVVRRTINELDHHAWMMDEFAGESSRSYWYPLNIHMSRSSGDPETIAREFIQNYKKLSPRVQSRLVLENEDKGLWTPDRLYNLIYQEIGVPITYDNLHHRCNPGEWSVEEAFSRCVDTWRSHDVKPLFHYSEGGANNNPRAHVDFATGTPAMFRQCHDIQCCIDIDWDIEIKQKDYALHHILEMEQRKNLIPV